jgi:hypothetical protein
MRFEYYHPGLADVPKLSVDGTVDNAIHFSHWQGNETPAQLKADTSTEIALNLVAAPNRNELARGIDLVTNNHFDTDGVLSVWTVLTGERALELRDRLIPAAEAGDFSEFSNEAAVRASIVIQGSDQPIPDSDSRSPLAAKLGATNADEASAYRLVLPEVERVLTRTDEYEPLWRSAWDQIATALESFEHGDSKVTELGDAGVSLVTLSPAVFSPSGFNPIRHAAPYTAISHYAKGRLFIIATPLKNGWSYRVDYPYYSWAETVVRPRTERRNFSQLLASLNQREGNDGGLWKSDQSELASAIKFLDDDGKLASSTLQPDEVANSIIAEVTSNQTAVAVL